jgi:hypothetical protein
MTLCRRCGHAKGVHSDGGMCTVDGCSCIEFTTDSSVKKLEYVKPKRKYTRHSKKVLVGSNLVSSINSCCDTLKELEEGFRGAADDLKNFRAGLDEKRKALDGQL